MTVVTVLYALIFYAATALMLGGLAYKIYQYAQTPAPLKIPTTPAPTTRFGVGLRLFREVVFFESLFKATKPTWLFGWVFHMALFIVLARHIRYFIEPVWLWVELIQPFGIYAAFAMLLGLAGLFARRFVVDRVRYISAPSDYLMLVLIFMIGATGLAMKFVFPTDIVAVKAFFAGLARFSWQPLPADPVLLIHLLLVAFLMAIFPFSKLLHIPGLFFSPTRNQVDNPREKRHIAPWARKLEAPPSSGR
jgi:nitrate reductase gamma subunit